jgi:phytoene dehydrogenase-like protein
VPFRELSPEGFDRYVFPDYEVRMCKGLDAYRDRLAADFPDQVEGLDKFFALVRQVRAALSAMARLNSLSAGWEAVKQLPMLARYHRATFADITESLISDPKLRAVLAAPGGDIGLPPSKASGLAMLGLLSHFLGGAYFPEGGTKALRDAYVHLLRTAGAELKRNSAVDRIITENGHITGVRTAKGESFYAPVVISNASAGATFGKLLDHSPRRLQKKASKSHYSLGSFCAFVGTDLDAAAAGLDDANVWHYSSWDIDAQYAPAFRGELPENAPFFLTVPTLKDPTGGHAPEGRHTVELITFAPWRAFSRWSEQKTLKRDEDYRQLKSQFGDALLQRAEHYLPNLRKHAEVVEFATPATNVSYTLSPEGAIYGMDHTPQQMGLGRFRTRTPVEGLYLCGADIFGCGIATCVSSGTLAAKLAMRQKKPLVQRATSSLRSLASRATS